MARLIAGRLAQAAATLLLLSAAAFALMALMPGDPVELALAADPRLGPEDAARARALHGLDRPAHARYLAWLGAVLEGRFGHSRLFARPAAEVLWPALASTLALVGAALALAAGGGIALAALAATGRRRARWVDAVALLAQSAPAFWVGMLLILLFAVSLGWLPAGGTGEDGGGGLSHLVLPVATLAFANVAAYARQGGAALRDALAEPWARAARARGASGARVLWRHALPNACVPLLTLVAVDAGALVSGALVTETLFARPGMGKLIHDAVMGNDHNLALLALLLAAGVTLLATLAADLAQRALDPRLRP